MMTCYFLIESVVVISVTIITSFNFLFHWSFQVIGPPGLTWLMQFYQSFNAGISSRGKLYSFQGVSRQGITDDRWQPCWLQHWISRPWYLKCYQALSTSGHATKVSVFYEYLWMPTSSPLHPSASLWRKDPDEEDLWRSAFLLHGCQKEWAARGARAVRCKRDSEKSQQ